MPMRVFSARHSHLSNHRAAAGIWLAFASAGIWVCGCSQDGEGPGSAPIDAQPISDAGPDTSVDQDTRDGDVDSSADGGSDIGDGKPVETGREAETSDALADDGPADSLDGSACTGWTFWNEGLSGGRADNVQFDSRNSRRLFASPGGQLYRSLDSGATWSLLSQATTGIRQLAFPPVDDAVLLAASQGGLERSDDGGVTWRTAALNGVALSTILIRATEPREMFVGGNGGIVFRSVDGGNSWQPANAGVPFGQVTAFAQNPTDASALTASVILTDSTGSWTTGAIVRTADTGQSWTTVLSTPGPVFQLSVCSANPAIIYGATTTGLVRSTDSGRTWITSDFAGRYVTVASVGGSDCNVVYANAGSEGLRRTTDGGQTWSAPLTSGMTLQAGAQFPEIVAIDPTAPMHVVAGTHGGLFTSTNGGDQWSEAPGIQSVMPRVVAMSPLNPGRIWMGTWGSGLWRREVGVGAWQKVSGLARDWIFSIMPDPKVSDRLFVGTHINGGGWLSTNNGMTFDTPVFTLDNPMVFAVDPANPSTIYIGGQLGGVYKSTNNGASWAAAGQGVPAYIQTLLVDPNANNVIYAGSNDKGLYRSTDAGASWSQVAPEFSMRGISCLLHIGPAPGSFYACVSDAGIFRSQDGTTWTALNQGLGSLKVTGLVHDGVTSTMYATVGAAVYRSVNGAAWSLFDPACPPPLGGGNPTILVDGTSRRLMIATGTAGVLVYPL